MYINDSSSSFVNNNTSLTQSSSPSGSSSFGQALQQKLAMNSRPITITDIKASANPVSASIVSQATGVVSTPTSSLQPAKESGVIIKSSDQKTSFLDNKYILYGGIGVLALGIIYFMTQD